MFLITFNLIFLNKYVKLTHMNPLSGHCHCLCSSLVVRATADQVQCTGMNPGFVDAFAIQIKWFITKNRNSMFYSRSFENKTNSLLDNFLKMCLNPVPVNSWMCDMPVESCNTSCERCVWR